jgi:polysaccharide biosynthesis protein PslH
MKSGLKILFLSRWFPFPADNGSKIRISNLIAHLSSCHEVDLLSFSEGVVSTQQLEEAGRFCKRVLVSPYRPFRPEGLRAIAAYLSIRPRSFVDTFDPEMAARVKKVHAAGKYDLVIASQVDMAPYALLVDEAVKILEEVELTSLYEQSFQPAPGWQKARRWLMWWKYAHYIRSILPLFQGATVASDIEYDRVLASAPRWPPIRVIPNGVDVASYKGNYPPPRPGSLIFAGALSYGPNLEAMRFFLTEIFPIIVSKNPSVRLSITGGVNGAQLDELPLDDRVHLTGYLADVRPAIAESWASIIPIKTGGGTRLKALESLALGTPFVSTEKGVEGLDFIPGRDFLLGDDAETLAWETLRLLADSSLRDRLAERGKKTVSERYDWAKIGPCFCEFVEELVFTNQNRKNNDHY